ncbi:helix-turn-helix transcriptional regulator [Actinomadura sp. DC4]|uniref:helix-turn-helix domain-containing protein n=1 Tax=Actinomadura sp. DC4 TaxID=3055069 RepID=UPI0025B1DFAE|nr:helix-turn-helix transcriptional regulator [Actinomadura sp. DC4]MDN3356105.1 helix-turn-helix transcriptional regulator [Actinomadura sp. DC4]
MPERAPSPTLRRRRLSSILRELRDASGMSAEEVAGRLEWGKGKPLYLESGQGVRPSPHDMSRLADLYGVTEAQREELMELARAARLKGWWSPFSKQLSLVYTTYIGLEAEAAALRAFQLAMIPGLVQTEEYARALISGSTELSADEVEQRVEVRAKRQMILTADDPVKLWLVLDEAAIRRIVGGPDVMRAQLQHLMELARTLPHLRLQVVPFGGGAHPGVVGAFTVLRFPHASDAPAVYIESVGGQLFVEGGDVEEYDDAFDRLAAAALPPADTITLITAAASDL